MTKYDGMSFPFPAFKCSKKVRRGNTTAGHADICASSYRTAQEGKITGLMSIDPSSAQSEKNDTPAIINERRLLLCHAIVVDIA